MSTESKSGLEHLPTDRRALLAGLGGLAAGTFLTAGRAEAGPLTPPGAPAPTPGPEPRIAVNKQNTPGDTSADYVISQPGSYYLTENLNIMGGHNGIQIAASYVTLDLNGFAVNGSGPSSHSRNGIVATQQSNLVVKNGIVCNWGWFGVLLNFGGCHNCTVENVTSQGNQITGIVVGDGGRVQRCTASDNGAGGIKVAYGCLVSDCVAYSNGTYGIDTHAAAHITGCSIYENGRYGISAYIGSTIKHNTIRRNADGGVYASSHAYILENCITGNSGTGILVEGSGSRIEGNQCRGMSTGIRITGQNCFVARNTCSANTVNWDIAANNKCLVVQGMNAPVILGNSGGADPGSDHPFANFTVSGTG